MQDEVSFSISEALEPVQHLEQEWEPTKLVKRIRDYFRKASKSLDFRERSWLALVNEYADCAFSSIFQAIGDRTWLDKVDFLLVLDAGIKEYFPENIMRKVPSEEYERAVLIAHDRAFEEQRFLPRIWDAMMALNITGKARKRALDSIDEGRKAALKGLRDPSAPHEVKAFVSRWIDSTLQRLNRSTQGDPESVFDEKQAEEIFKMLLACAMPTVLTSEHGMPPKDWPFVEFAVRAAWAVRAAPEARPPPRATVGPMKDEDRDDREIGAAYALPVPAAPPGQFLNVLDKSRFMAVKEEPMDLPSGMPMSVPPMHLALPCEAGAIPPPPLVNMSPVLPVPPVPAVPAVPVPVLSAPPVPPVPVPPIPGPPMEPPPRVVPPKYTAVPQPSFSKSTSQVFAKHAVKGPAAAKSVKLEPPPVLPSPVTERLETKVEPATKSGLPWPHPKRAASKGGFHKKRFGRNLPEDAFARPLVRHRTK